MTIAIRRANGEQVLFDAVTNFSLSHSGSVSENPIERKSNVSDHFTHNNPEIRISGVISNAEYHTKVPTGNFLNTLFPISTTPVVGSETGLLDKLIPDSYKWLVGDSGPPSVTLTQSVNRRESGMQISAEVWLTSLFANKEIVSVLKFDNGRLQVVHDNYIITSLSFDETPDSGSALYPEISLKYVRRFSIASTTLPAGLIEVKKKDGGKKDGSKEKGKTEEKTKEDVASNPSTIKEDVEVDRPESKKL